MDIKDLPLKVFNDLDDSYSEITNAIHARDSSITLEELYEKLLMFDANCKNNSNNISRAFPLPPAHPTTANHVVYSNYNGSQRQSP
ncbi:hypothetical protein DITRI_Ditri19aG0190300 [Diplodiscus trichospermus]